MIGLNTGHLVYNYGTKLQAYAMQTLLSQSGERVEIIQWHNKNFGVLNSVSDNVKMLKRIKSKYDRKYWRDVYARYETLNEFNKKFNIHKFYGTLDDMQRNTAIYDLVFCGSDQAWLPGNIDHHWYTLEICADSVFKAAYAPSFGIESIPFEYKNKYQSFLSKLDAISVREVSGQKIVKEMIGKSVPVVLDPTLLLSRDDWNELKKEHSFDTICKDGYVFCYFLGNNKQHRDAVKELAEKTSRKIVNLAHFSGYCEADVDFADIDLYKVSPQDFIYLIDNADYVCTDSFHCTAFSIQYHKNFTVFHRFKSTDLESTNTRLYSLLGQLGLQGRIASDGQPAIFDDINFDVVDEALMVLRQTSSEFLNNALSRKGNV